MHPLQNWPWLAVLAAAVILALAFFGLGLALGRRREKSSLQDATARAATSSASPEGPQTASESAWPEAVRAGQPKVALIINPSKNDADRALRLVRAACSVRGWAAPLVLETTVEDPGEGMTREALRHGATIIIGAGGDGTVRVLSRILADESENPDHVPLGIIPLGTGNLLARNLEIEVSKLDPSAMEAAVEVALEGVPRKIDTAVIDIENADGGSTRDTFLVMGGIGLDAEVIAATNDDLKKKVGWLAYTDAGIRLLPGERKTVEISIDGRPFERRKIRSVLFANIGRLPTGLDFVPGAEVDDGFLSIVIMSPRSILGWGWIALKTISRYKADIPVMSYEKASRIIVRTPEPMDTQLDGDLSGAAVQVEARILPRSLTVNTPKKTPSLFQRLSSQD